MSMSRMAVAAWSVGILGLTSHPHAAAAEPGELEQVKSQLAELRQAYEARLQALEKRIADLQQAQAASPARTTPGVPAPEAANAAPAVAASPAVTGATTSAATSFNPAISLILAGSYANLSRNPDTYRLQGFVPDRRRGRPGTARLRHRRVGAGPRRQHRSDVLRSADGRVRRRQRGRRRGSVVPGHRPRRGRQPARRPLPLRHRLPQRAPRPYLGLRRRAARLPGVLRRTDQDRRPASALGRSRRSLRRDRRRDRLGLVVSRQRRRPQRHRLDDALRPRRRRPRRERELARRRLAARPPRRRPRLRRLRQRRRPGHEQLQRADADLGPRRHLQVGARRQCATAQLHAAGRVLPAPRARHLEPRHARRRRPELDRRLPRDAERLVPAGGLPVHADVARRRPLRPPRFRLAATSARSTAAASAPPTSRSCRAHGRRARR